MTGCPALRRAELHLRVAEALEQAHATGASRRPGRARLPLRRRGARWTDRERAIEYSLLAGRAALRTLDFDEAAARFAFALELGIDDPRRRAETQLELGTARFRAGGSDDAMEAFRAAAQIARDLGDPSCSPRAAVGFEEACWRPGDHGRGRRRAARGGVAGARGRGLRAAGDAARRAGPRPRVHRRLRGERRPSARQAIAMARRLDDRLGLATVLVRSYWSRGDGSLARDARDAAPRPATSPKRSAQAICRPRRWSGGCAGADRAQASSGAPSRSSPRSTRWPCALRQPFTLHVAEHYASTIALCVGRLAEAEAAAQRSHEWSRLLTGRPASGIYGIQMFGIRREQGRLAELAAVTRVLAGGERLRGRWRPAFAALLAELGMEEEARRELARGARARAWTSFAPRSGWRR